MDELSWTVRHSKYKFWIVYIFYLSSGMFLRAVGSLQLSDYEYTVIRGVDQYNADKIQIAGATDSDCTPICNALNGHGTCKCQCDANAMTFSSRELKCVSGKTAREACGLRINAGATDVLFPVNLERKVDRADDKYKLVHIDNKNNWFQNAGSCSVDKIIQFLNNGTWKSDTQPLFSLYENPKNSKVNYHLGWSTTNTLSGRLLKLSIQCTDKKECMVIKIRGNYTYYPGKQVTSSSVVPTPSSTAAMTTTSVPPTPDGTQATVSPTSSSQVQPRPTTVAPSLKPTKGEEGDKMARQDDDSEDSTVVVAAISAAAAVICVAIISLSVCFIVKKRHRHPHESGNPAMDSTTMVIQNNFPLDLMSPTLRNPNYNDFSQEAVYAECIPNSDSTPDILKNPAGKNNLNNGRESVYDNEKAAKVPADDSMYQPLLPGLRKFSQNESTQDPTPQYLPLTKSPTNPTSITNQRGGNPRGTGLDNPDYIDLVQSGPATAHPTDHEYGTLDVSQTNYMPLSKTSDEYDKLARSGAGKLQPNHGTPGGIGVLQKPEEPGHEYGVLENPDEPQNEYGVLENPDEPENEYGVLENPDEPENHEYGVLENPEEPQNEYGVLENPDEPEHEYGVLENPDAGRPDAEYADPRGDYTALDRGVYQSLKMQ